MERLKMLLGGNLSKKFVIHIYLPITIGVLIGGLVLARLFFPYIEEYPYQWTTSTISRLGWPHENPIGLVFFSVGYCIFGIAMLPLTCYAHKRYAKIKKKRAAAIRAFMVAAFIAVTLIGVIPNYREPKIFLTIHGINALIAFTGFYIAFSLIAILIVQNNKLGNNIFPKRGFLLYFAVLIYGLVCVAMMVISGLQNFSGDQYVHDPSTPTYLSGPFYEWQAFIAILALIYLQFLALPEQIN